MSHESPCIKWTGLIDRDGYGRDQIDGMSYRVHRLAFEKKLGRKLLPNEWVLHSCSARSCFNPDHLRLNVRMVLTNEHAAYQSWRAMRKRCQCADHKDYPGYGGRGISICKEWEDFWTFARDMGPRPKGTSIDRIDNNGNYEPGNCRWATPFEQARNTRSSRMITHDGKTLCAADWARHFGVDATAIHYRIKRYGLENALKGLSK